MKTKKIITEYFPVPSHQRQFDWSAFREYYDKDSLVGCGATKQESINDLLLLERDLIMDRIAEILSGYPNLDGTDIESIPEDIMSLLENMDL